VRCSAPRREARRFRFGSPCGPILVWLKVEELRPFALVAESADCLAEGELRFF